MVFPELGAAGGGPSRSPVASGCGAPWVHDPGPGYAGAWRGRFLRGKTAGVTSKRATARPQSAPPGAKLDGKPRRSRSPPPRPRRSRPPSFGAAQSFGINEKSLRKGYGGLGSPPTPAPPPPSLISPRCCRFSPFPARPRLDPPSPGGKEDGRGGWRGGQLRTGPPTLSFSLNSSGADSAERGKFFIRGGNLKKKKKLHPAKGKGKKAGSGGERA